MPREFSIRTSCAWCGKRILKKDAKTSVKRGDLRLHYRCVGNYDRCWEDLEAREIKARRE